MTEVLRKGRYRARLAETDHDIETAQRFRHLCFMERGGAQASAGRARPGPVRRPMPACAGRGSGHGPDWSAASGCWLLPGGRALGESYSAQSYDLAGLAGLCGPDDRAGAVLHATLTLLDPDVLRIAWGALTRLVDAAGVGCCLAARAFPAPIRRPLAPALPCWPRGIWARRTGGPPPAPAQTAPLAGTAAGRGPRCAQALRHLPPLLRTYLAMGGWVSAQAVIDRRMNTLHVFTGLEIASVPPRRAAALRALAQ